MNLHNQPISYENRGNLSVLRLTEDALRASEETKETLEKTLLDSDCTMYIVSLAGIERIDSMGIGVLVSLHVLCTVEEYQLFFVDLEPSIKRFFDKTQMDKILQLFGTLDDAVTFLSATP